MKPIDMVAAAREAFAAGTKVNFTFPNCFVAPSGFPRGEVLCSGENGTTVAFEPDEIVAWLVDNGVVPQSEGFLTTGRPSS